MPTCFFSHSIIGINLSTPNVLATLGCSDNPNVGPLLGNGHDYLARLITAIEFALEDILNDDPTEENIEIAHEQLHKVRSKFVPAAKIIGPAPAPDHDRVLLYAEDIILAAIGPYLRCKQSTLLSVYIVPGKGRVNDGGPSPGTVLFGLRPIGYISGQSAFSCLPVLATKSVTVYNWITTS